MKRTAYLSVFLSLVLAGVAAGQDISIPEKLAARTGRLASIEIKTTAKDTRWQVVPAGEIDVFREFDSDASVIRLRFMPYKDGTYTLIVAGAIGDKLGMKSCEITASGGVSPGPGPTPPLPPSPEPKTDSPFPTDGLRVLIVYESAKTLPLGQHSAIYGKKTRDYLDAKCVKAGDGTPDRRIVDQDLDVSAWPVFEKAMKLPRTSLPWIVIGGKASWFSGPLPANVDDTLLLLKKYGE